MEGLLARASEIYAVAYFGIIIVVSLLEGVVPRRAAGDTLRLRWASNFSITILDTILLRSLFPLAGFGWAIFCHERGWGLFNHIALPRGMALRSRRSTAATARGSAGSSCASRGDRRSSTRS